MCPNEQYKNINQKFRIINFVVDNYEPYVYFYYFGITIKDVFVLCISVELLCLIDIKTNLTGEVECCMI